MPNHCCQSLKPPPRSRAYLDNFGPHGEAIAEELGVATNRYTSVIVKA